MTPAPVEGPAGKKTPGDFIFGKVIGEGSFSTVYLAKCVHTSKEYAIKVLEKRHIIRERKNEYVTREKQVLQILGNSCNYFVRLFCTFQDTERLYFVLTYAKNGELLQQMNKNKGFNLECSKYYSAELLLALEYLNKKGIIHRDLKPENVLFDNNWHILITDFGSAKIVRESNNKEEEDKQKRRKNSFVGTAQYVSPEVLTNLESTYSSDLWAYGCIIYQMLSGQMPFHAGSEYLVFQKILKLEYEFPEGFNKEAKDLVENLLVIEPESRLGAKDFRPYSSIRAHAFFNGTNFENLGEPPKISDEIQPSGSVSIPDHLEPGLDGQKASRLHLELLHPATPLRMKSEPNKKIYELGDEEIKERLDTQRISNSFHNFVENNLIIKQGLIDKKKGLFARRRMFLLTVGPHLYYVDPATMVLKGEIPWSADLKTEAKNFKTFFVHTPNRTYYLEDPEGYALEWCKTIEEVKSFYFPDK